MKQKQPPKTRAQVRAEFDRKGISITAWAQEHGVGRSLVYEILTGTRHRTCSRGQSHRVAVLLGLKHGEIAANSSAVNAVNLPRSTRSRKVA